MFVKVRQLVIVDYCCYFVIFVIVRRPAILVLAVIPTFVLVPTSDPS